MIKDNAFMQKILKIAWCKIYIAENWLAPVALLATRLYVGRFFWQSGQTKISTPGSARALFESEYIPNWQAHHIKRLWGMDIPFPVPGAAFGVTASTFSELVFSALLMTGLMGRVAALGIFMMTLAIEMFVYPGTDEHYYWMLTMAIIMAYGPGKISVDHFIRKKLLDNAAG
jgi:putative oxidoreductase